MRSRHSPIFPNRLRTIDVNLTENLKNLIDEIIPSHRLGGMGLDLCRRPAGADVQAQGDKTIPVVEVEAPNVQHLWNRAYWHEEHTGKTMQGEILDASFDFFEQADAAVTEDGTVWTLRIRVEDAPALCVYFDAFHLPIGFLVDVPIGGGSVQQPVC